MCLLRDAEILKMGRDWLSAEWAGGKHGEVYGPRETDSQKSLNKESLEKR